MAERIKNIKRVLKSNQEEIQEAVQDAAKTVIVLLKLSLFYDDPKTFKKYTEESIGDFSDCVWDELVCLEEYTQLIRAYDIIYNQKRIKDWDNKDWVAITKILHRLTEIRCAEHLLGPDALYLELDPAFVENIDVVKRRLMGSSWFMDFEHADN